MARKRLHLYGRVVAVRTRFGGDYVSLTIEIPARLAIALRARAQRDGVTMSAVARVALLTHLRGGGQIENEEGQGR